jgi:glutamate-5-semialdehyde dehydrogenase
MDMKTHCTLMAQRALSASRAMLATTSAQRAAALRLIAQRLRESSASLIAANAKDLQAGQAAGLAPAMLERLKLDEKGVAKIANSVSQIADQTDPVGQIIEGSVRPSGLRLQKVRVPLGVVLIIFESRPNVTSDAAALCIKSGNAAILRGGKEAAHSNAAIADIVRSSLRDAGLNPDTVQLVDTTDRQAVTELLQLDSLIDLVIPRGGESLIRAVVEQSTIPVIKHYTGNCHVYVDDHADATMALDICINSKTQRTGVCNAAETMLFHQATVSSGLMADVCKALLKSGVELRGCERTLKLLGKHDKLIPAIEEDWAAEYLDMICAVRVVDDIDAAIEHINRYGSRHTDAIVTSYLPHAERFVQRVDSANVFVNVSTRLSDGGEYGLGAEIGISTDKLHARGPMGAADLTTYKWVGYGDGVLRS